MKKFQLTRPAWGVTIKRGVKHQNNRFQLTRPAWGVTYFNIFRLTKSIFQLTRPAWGVTLITCVLPITGQISTHTPCVGRDPLGVISCNH